MFLWSILSDALPTGNNRSKVQETALHLFFTCSFAIKVWKLIPLQSPVHTAGFQSFEQGVIAFKRTICLPPTGISVPWILWVIWTSRKESPPRKQRGKVFAVQATRKSTLIPMKRSTESIYCNTDASWDADLNTAGLARLPLQKIHRIPPYGRSLGSPVQSSHGSIA